MTTQVFTWAPSLEIVGTTKYVVRTAQFGDGFSQSVQDGINNRFDTYPLTFSGDGTKIAAIKAFLDSTGGYQAFNWTPPLRAQGLFKCDTPTIQPHGANSYTLTVNFVEVFSV
ncbi:phage tail protein [Paraburkholderia fungorum]|uniref:phage tail protein n=1 Tax=Paraburkholderia fungorum TaxID=134537 RepID=UPI0038B74BC6